MTRDYCDSLLAQQASSVAILPGLFILLLLGVFLLMGIALLVTLIARSKTRIFGLLLGLFIVGGALAAMGLTAVRSQQAVVVHSAHRTLDGPVEIMEVARIELDESEATAAEPLDTLNTTSDKGEQDSANEQIPAWVTAPAKRIDSVWRETVSSDPFTSYGECVDDVEPKLMKAVAKYMSEYLGTGRLDSAALRGMGITPDYIRTEICTDETTTTREYEFGPMETLHSYLQFNSSVHDDLERRWEEAQRVRQLRTVSWAGAGLFGLLGLAYSLLRIDTWTKGYYTKRLFIGVPLALLGLGAALLFLNFL